MEIEPVMNIAKRRGFVFPSSEIYGGLSGFFDLGPVGLLLRRKIENSWREFFIKSQDNIFEIETSIIMHEKVWKASGHLDGFTDPLTQCRKCHSFYRADNIIEEKTGKFVESLNTEELTELIKKNKLKCPKCKGDLGEAKIFNLMLSSNIGPVTGNVAYLRPETAQGIFTNFKNILVSTRAALPFGVAQIGYSYRNEISPRQWIIRLRELRQMEIEYFFNPDKISVPDREVLKTKIPIVTREVQKKENFEAVKKEAGNLVKEKIIPNELIAYFIAKEFLWYQQLGIPSSALRFRHMQPEETPHYSKGNFDMEINFDFGWKEATGNAYRTDHDLSTHMKHSGTDFSVVEDGKKIVPHVVEPSFGIDRAIYATLLFCYRDGKERGWEWFEFPSKIAPYVAGVYPLMNKDKLPEKAREVYEMLKKCWDVFYDGSGSIGKRYARADEIGTPYCITIDHDTLKDNSVTIRDRNTTKQIRVKIKDLTNIIWKLLNEEIKFEKAGS